MKQLAGRHTTVFFIKTVLIKPILPNIFICSICTFQVHPFVLYEATSFLFQKLLYHAILSALCTLQHSRNCKCSCSCNWSVLDLYCVVLYSSVTLLCSEFGASLWPILAIFRPSGYTYIDTISANVGGKKMIGPRWSSIYKNLSNSSISYSMWYGSSLYTVLAEQLRKCSLCIKHYKPHSLSCERRKLLRVTLADSTTCSCLTPQWRSNHDDDPQTIQLELCQLPTLSTRFIASSPYTAPVLAWDFCV